MSKLASVIGGTIELPSGKTVEVGSRQWFKWLEHPETKSFRVDDGEGYTARKETAKGYWYAYRKVEGKLHKRYIGISEALTVERLAEVGGLFDIPSQPKLPKAVGNSAGNNSELHNELGNLQAENEALKVELAEARSQLEDFVTRKAQLKAKMHEVLDEQRMLVIEKDLWQGRLSDAAHDLKAEQNKRLQANDAVRKLEREISELRSQLSTLTAPQLSTILEFPDAATLLNQLKSKRKKSKTDLQDVEVILEMLELD